MTGLSKSQTLQSVIEYVQPVEQALPNLCMLFPSWLAHMLNKCTCVVMQFVVCDDSLGPLVMFTQQVYNGTEGDNATVCLILNGEAVFDITVTLASMNDNAEGNVCDV